LLAQVVYSPCQLVSLEDEHQENAKSYIVARLDT
jgi:hypothetical protein